jgi:hypothetical protein
MSIFVQVLACSLAICTSLRCCLPGLFADVVHHHVLLPLFRGYECF